MALRVSPTTRVAAWSGVDFLLGDATTLAGLAGVADRVGLMIDVDVATAQPFAVARRLATLDHLSGGRAGVLLTGGPADRADEFAAVIEALWSSWAPDAVLADDATGRYVDPTRIRPIDHSGVHFQVSGVATLPAGPHAHPLVLFDDRQTVTIADL